jgi:hypothetical protein
VNFEESKRVTHDSTTLQQNKQKDVIDRVETKWQTKKAANHRLASYSQLERDI